jgi:hypothetical protein
VGAAQDLAELDIDLAAITQAGGWESPRTRTAWPTKNTPAAAADFDDGLELEAVEGVELRRSVKSDYAY